MTDRLKKITYHHLYAYQWEHADTEAEATCGKRGNMVVRGEDVGESLGYELAYGKPHNGNYGSPNHRIT